MRRSATFIALLAFLLVGGLTAGAQAAGRNPRGHAGGQNTLHGKIVSVAQDGSSMVVQTGGKNGQQITVTFANKVSVLIDGKSSAVAQLAAGDRVRVTPKTGFAMEVQARTPGKHGKNNGAAAAAKV